MEISFYGKHGVIDHVTVSDELFIRLAKSEFSKIGRSKVTPICLDEERVRLPLVALRKAVRTNLGRFLVCFIAEEVERLIDRCGTRPTGREVEPFLSNLESLIQISRAVGNEKALFLHRR
jgi:hypothetical protein